MTNKEKQQKLRALQLEILDETLRVFQELEVSYFAGFGTLLGAFRHQGYIPWDDDIDLIIFPESYPKLIQAAPDILNKDFYFQSHLNNVHNIISWCRIGLRNTTSISTRYQDNLGEWGICIDIFPLIATGNPDSRIHKTKIHKAKEYIRLCRKYDYLLDAKHGNPLRKAYSYWQARESDQANLRKCNSLMAELFAPATTENTHYICTDDLSIAYPREIIEIPDNETSRLCLFEGKELYTPYDSDAVLTRMYGDWRTPPPVDCRTNHTEHDDIILSFDTPWTKFLRNSES